MSFEIVRQRQLFGGMVDANPAGSTASTPATNRDMRPARSPTDFQNRETDRRVDGHVVGIRNSEPFMSPQGIAKLGAGKHSGDQSQPGVADPFFQLSARRCAS